MWLFVCLLMLNVDYVLCSVCEVYTYITIALTHADYDDLSIL